MLNRPHQTIGQIIDEAKGSATDDVEDDLA